MKEEMKRVSWTSKEDLFSFGKIVIGAIFALGLGIYLVDLFIFRKLLKDITEPYLVPRETDLMKFLKNVINK